MNMTAEMLAGAKTGMGAPVRRVEDQRFLTGSGHYVDDLTLPDMSYAHVVRSPHAHAEIRSIDVSAAAANKIRVSPVGRLSVVPTQEDVGA